MPALASASPVCRQQQAQPQPQQRSQMVRLVQSSRREMLAGLVGAAALVAARPAAATGLESFDLPPIDTPEIVAQLKARNQQVLDDAEASFQNSGGRETGTSVCGVQGELEVPGLIVSGIGSWWWVQVAHLSAHLRAADGMAHRPSPL